MGLAKRAGASASLFTAPVLVAAMGFVRPAAAALVVDLHNGGCVIADNGAFDRDPNLGSIINNTVVAGFRVDRRN